MKTLMRDDWSFRVLVSASEEEKNVSRRTNKKNETNR